MNDAGPIPLADMKVIEEMQIGIAAGFAEVHEARAAGRPVVWGSILIPKEIIHAMEVPMIYGEVLGAYASMMGLSAKYASLAEERGLSRDVCAVHRCMVGLGCATEREPFFEMAFVKPDLVLGGNFPCMSSSKSFLHICEHYQLPYYFTDVPINTWGKAADIPQHAVDYYVAELRGMIAFLERYGYRLRWERLQEEVAFTRQLGRLLAEVDTYKRARPCPLRAYDNVIASTAPAALGKQHRTLAIFERYRDELRQRVERGIGVIPDEKLRLLWIGVPPLCDFHLLDHPEQRGAVVVKNMLEFLTGFTLDPDLLDPERPLESIARAMLSSPFNPLYGNLVDYLVRAAREYQVDGVISVVKRSCGLVPGLQRLTKEAIFRETGVPTVVFELDGVDAREYEPAATKATIDAFIDTLKARRGS